MFRSIPQVLVALVLLAGPTAAQTFALPELGLQNAGKCRQLALRDRTNTAMVPLGCLDTTRHVWSLLGDVSSASVAVSGFSGTPARALEDKLADLPVNVNDFKPLISGSDATAAVQAAINTGIALNRPVRCDGRYNVTQVTIDAPPSGFAILGSCSLVGIATTPLAAVLVLKSSGLSIGGSLVVDGNYNTNYEAVVGWTTTTQYSNVSNLSFNGGKVCLSIGTAGAPSALMSEITISGGRTYGCTQVLKVVGIEAVVHVVGAQWSSDAFGAPSQTWAGIPFRGIVNVGGDVTVTGGELIMPTTANGALIEAQPLTGSMGEGTYYARTRLNHVTMETASPLAVTSNPAGLAIAPRANQRGLLSFIGCNGFHSQDVAPFISTSADFDGEIIVERSRFIFPGTRTQPNVAAAGTKTDIHVDDTGFGPGFADPIAGSVGGVLHYGTRQILAVNNLNGQAIASGSTTLRYRGLDNAGNRNRFASAFDAATGTFTVPAGGLRDMRITATAQLGGSGTMYVNKTDGSGNTAQVAAAGYSNGTASIVYDANDVAAGEKYSILIGTGSATTAGTPDYFNTLRIHARN